MAFTLIKKRENSSYFYCFLGMLRKSCSKIFSVPVWGKMCSENSALFQKVAYPDSMPLYVSLGKATRSQPWVTSDSVLRSTGSKAVSRGMWQPGLLALRLVRISHLFSSCLFFLHLLFLVFIGISHNIIVTLQKNNQVAQKTCYWKNNTSVSQQLSLRFKI